MINPATVNRLLYFIMASQHQILIFTAETTQTALVHGLYRTGLIT